MEFRNPLEEYSDDDDRRLSFCDLVIEGGVEEIALRDSNTGSLDQEAFGFDFDFGLCFSTTENVFPADHLFRQGRLLPLAPQRCQTESAQYSPVEKSISEYLQTRRNDSLDSQSSLWSTSSSNSSSSQRKTYSGLRNSKSKGKGKMSAIWRVLTLGLIKPPSIKLEDMRLRQGKTTNNINGEKNLDLRRFVSCNYDKDPKLEGKKAKAVNFQEKCRSVKEPVVVVKQTPCLKRWKTLARLPSLQSGKA